MFAREVAALRAGEECASHTQWWLCRVVAERCRDCGAAWLVDADTNAVAHANVPPIANTAAFPKGENQR